MRTRRRPASKLKIAALTPISRLGEGLVCRASITSRPRRMVAPRPSGSTPARNS
jgi:hypothetical protein